MTNKGEMIDETGSAEHGSNHGLIEAAGHGSRHADRHDDPHDGLQGGETIVDVTLAESRQRRVRILSSHVADQIAAGEVVERPASVVKELVENSLDAGATDIKVMVEGGGKRLIEIVDNGRGMSREDALLAVERFGTSKIVSAEDLWQIQTYGFRGEALPSIAAVSRFCLKTKDVSMQPGRGDGESHRHIEDRSSQNQPNDQHGHTEQVRQSGVEIHGVEVYIEGGKLRNVRPTGLAQGTVIQVRDLFFNVPARRKFMRTDPTEQGVIRSTVVDFALINPGVRFVFSAEGGASAVYAPCRSLVERGQELEIAGKDCFAISWEERGFLVQGVLSTPVEAIQSPLATPGKLRLFVNGRAVRDGIIIKAIREGFGNFLKPGYFPHGVVSLTLPAALVDVNVHPRKSEIRFHNSGEVFAVVSKAVGRALSRFDHLAGVMLGGVNEASGLQTSGTVSTEGQASGNGTAGEAGDDIGMAHVGRNASLFAQRGVAGGRGYQEDACNGWNGVWDNGARSITGDDSGAGSSQSSLIAETPFAPPLADSGIRDGGANEGRDVAMGHRNQKGIDYRKLLEWRYHGEVLSCYLLFEGDGNLVLVDLHAAHERVRFYVLRRQILKEGKLAEQMLINPVIVSISPDSIEGFVSAQEALKRLGMDCELFGDNSVVIRSTPALLRGVAPEALFRDLEEVSAWGSWSRQFELKLESVISRMACHSSVRSGRQLKVEEVYELIAQIADAEENAFCPHGRPIATVLSGYDIQKLFGRVM